MSTFRVVMEYEIEADDADTAKDLAMHGEPTVTRIRELAAPTPKTTPEAYYDQLITTLDLAWDRYMDQSVAIEIRPDDGITYPRLPTLVELSMGSSMATVHLSLLFDCAITAYRDWVEDTGGTD